MLRQFSNSLSLAVLKTVAYSDIFDYPLTAREIHQYLTGAEASVEEIVSVLEEEIAVTRTGDYFTLRGREDTIRIRLQREAHSRELLPHAVKYGRLLGTLPYIRMVALTGSLAVMNVSRDRDFDYMLVTAPGRVWTARAFVLAFNRLARLRGHTLCPNLILSESALHWSTHDLYSARELCQMIPITNMDVYQQLLAANAWTKKYLPNWSHKSSREQNMADVTSTVKFSFEFILQSNLGDRFEQWEMNRKIARFSRQAGFGEETVFNAEVCQGNFHHHRQWARQALKDRLNQLSIDLPLSVGERLGVTAV